ncbi:P-loop containing nucleoside triphosphatehydrolase [Vibrio phage 150E35-1]|nr:P-loop containing nucleoside triphosphatehydrolase [Vibrio phage 150E35-1]
MSIPDSITSMIASRFPFTTSRAGQDEIIWECMQAYAAGKRFAVLDVGTGGGKSVIGVTAAGVISDHLNNTAQSKLSEQIASGIFSGQIPPTHQPKSPTVLTKTRVLQHQYDDSFRNAPNLDVALLYGKKHYSDLPDPTPDSMTVHTCGKTCPGMSKVHEKGECPYELAKMQYLDHRTTGICNNSMYLASDRFREGVNVLVVDECHNLVNDLIDRSSFGISSQRILNIMEELGLPNQEYVRTCINYERTKFKDGRLVVQMLVNHLDQLIGFTTAQLIPRIGEQIEVLQNANPTMTARMKKMVSRLEGYLDYFKDLKYKKKMLLNSDPSEWVSWKEEHKHWGHVINFKPFEPLKWVVESLFEKNDFVIFMSATPGLYPEFCRQMHLDVAHGMHVYAPTPFPIENRQVQALNIAAMNYTNREELLAADGAFTMTTKSLMSRHLGERGLIHSVSYANAEMLKESLGDAGKRLVIPERGVLINREYIEKFPADTVFISPSIAEGVSFDDSLARFQIILKIPFGSLGDIWIKSKLDKDREWYANEAALVVQQMAGRITRSPTDYGTTYILDSSFDRVKAFMPSWFLEALVEI